MKISQPHRNSLRTSQSCHMFTVFLLLQKFNQLNDMNCFVLWVQYSTDTWFLYLRHLDLSWISSLTRVIWGQFHFLEHVYLIIRGFWISFAQSLSSRCLHEAVVFHYPVFQSSLLCIFLSLLRILFVPLRPSSCIENTVTI